MRRRIRTQSGSSRQRGISAMELLTTIAVVAVTTLFAVPSVQDFSRRSALTARSNELLGVLMQARQQAVRERAPVLVVASAGDFAHAVRTGVDVNRDGILNEDEPILNQLSAADSSVHSPQGVADLGFNNFGAVVGSQQQSLLLCGKGWTSDNDDHYARTVVVHASGRIEVVRGSQSAAASCEQAAS